MTTTSKRLLRSTLLATAFVVILSLLALVPYLAFFAYPLLPGIGISGLIFSSSIESTHELRFEVAAIFLNIAIYAALFYFIFREPRIRSRRRHSSAGYYTSSHTTSSSHEPTTALPSLPESPVREDE
jgi:hypothetical protein